MFPPAIYQFLNIQICLHTGPNIDPEQRDVVDIASDKEKLREFISAKFPKVESIPSIEESCIYTLSPDGVHILDKHPRYPNIVVGCGFSGNKFRYSQELLWVMSSQFLKNTVESRFSKRKYSKESRFSKDFGASHFTTVME